VIERNGGTLAQAHRRRRAKFCGSTGSSCNALVSDWRFNPECLKPIDVIAPWRHDPFGKEDALLRFQSLSRWE
jgi:hypothetical protein